MAEVGKLTVAVDTSAVTEALALVKELAEAVEKAQAAIKRLAANDITPSVDLVQGEDA